MARDRVIVRKALGLIETRGLVAAIEAADVAVKTAGVQLPAYHLVTGGLVTVFVLGEVAAVKAAVEAGSAAAARVGELVASHVIPHPHPETVMLYPAPPGEGMYTGDLEGLSLLELREVARGMGGLGLTGIQISRANRKRLLKEIRRFLSRGRDEG